MSTDTEFENKACMQYEALLEDYLGGELSAAEAQTAEQHWRNCAGCRDALEQASKSVHLLRLAGPSDGPGPAFARTVMARIRAVARDAAIPDRAGFWQPLVRLGWRFAATATVLLAVLVTYDAGWGRRAQRNMRDARLIGVSDIFAPDPVNPPASRDEVLMMEAETNHGK
jgi:anti-sigma-K factor RskA